MSEAKNRRVLLVDDTPSIHEDYRKILGGPQASAEEADLRAAFFGEPRREPRAGGYEFDSAFQGQQALEMVRAACAAGRPYALAFVDVRMPPGWDGIETIARLWEVDTDLQVVVCTAFSDYSWDDMLAKLGQSDRLLILKKPFDPVEVCQLALSTTETWNLRIRERTRVEEARRAEQEARAYAASIRTANRALDAARARSEASAVSRAAFLVHLADKVGHPLRAVREIIEAACSRGAAAPVPPELLARAEGLCRVFDNLSEYARLEAGTLDVGRRPCSPFAIAEGVRARLAERARERGLELAVESAGPVPETIETDPERVGDALATLVANALRFTREGSVKIRVGPWDASPHEEPQVAFEVVDTGVGVREEDLGRLFEPFQPDEPRDRAYDGTRLGLAVARRIAQRLGGDLSVESAPGAGSRFTLRVRTGDLAGVRTSELPRAPLPSEAAEPAREDPARMRP